MRERATASVTARTPRRPRRNGIRPCDGILNPGERRTPRRTATRAIVRTAPASAGDPSRRLSAPARRRRATTGVGRLTRAFPGFLDGNARRRVAPEMWRAPREGKGDGGPAPRRSRSLFMAAEQQFPLDREKTGPSPRQRRTLRGPLDIGGEGAEGGENLGPGTESDFHARIGESRSARTPPMTARASGRGRWSGRGRDRSRDRSGGVPRADRVSIPTLAIRPLGTRWSTRLDRGCGSRPVRPEADVILPVPEPGRQTS